MSFSNSKKKRWRRRNVRVRAGWRREISAFTPLLGLLNLELSEGWCKPNLHLPFDPLLPKRGSSKRTAEVTGANRQFNQPQTKRRTWLLFLPNHKINLKAMGLLQKKRAQFFFIYSNFWVFRVHKHFQHLSTFFTFSICQMFQTEYFSTTSQQV